tara:strand:+ start:12813 stop:12917 length:105 start_codon:yes stop_codon:yes gene_type:complete
MELLSKDVSVVVDEVPEVLVFVGVVVVFVGGVCV